MIIIKTLPVCNIFSIFHFLEKKIKPNWCARDEDNLVFIIIYIPLLLLLILKLTNMPEQY